MQVGTQRSRHAKKDRQIAGKLSSCWRGWQHCWLWRKQRKLGL